MNDIKMIADIAVGIKVLYVEDNESLRESFHETLELFFIDVDCASNGKLGLEKFRALRHDLIITDISMPVMDGMEMLKEIKAHDHDVEVIVTSAYGDENNLVELIDLGVSRFVKKPIEKQKVIEVIGLCCKAINDKQFESYYKSELEKKNNALEEKNSELKKVIKVLHSKLAQLHPPQAIQHSGHSDVVITNDDVSKYEELEKRLDSMVSSALHSKNIGSDKMKNFASVLKTYAQLLSDSGASEIIVSALSELSKHAKDFQPKDALQITKVFDILESLVFILSKWRRGLMKTAKKKSVSIYDASILTDIEMVLKEIRAQ